jgi:hypothetical protein
MRNFKLREYLRKTAFCRDVVSVAIAFIMPTKINISFGL